MANVSSFLVRPARPWLRRVWLSGGLNADYLIQDFAAVVAFALRVTCTPDLDLTRRLTQSSRLALGIPQPPRAYVGRVFEARAASDAADVDLLQPSVRDLVGLRRQGYEDAIRAIRRYVTGLHRIGDDLDLAYTLLVASIESLAQEIDALTPTWSDYDQQERQTLDTALAGVDPLAADRAGD